MFLRQSTAQVIRFGPCLDKTDGLTEETGLTLAQADMRLSKDGAAFAQKSAAGNATHDSDGWYSTTLSTTDTATVGILKLNVHQPATMLPVWETFYVVEEAIYDALYAASSNAFNGAAGSTAVGLVDLVTTTTTNTDMVAEAPTDVATGTKQDTMETTLDAAATASSITALNDLSASDVNAQVDSAWTTQMADSVAADGSISTREQALYLAIQFLTEFAISGTTITVKKVDGATSLATFTLDDGTTPTSLTRAT